MSTSASRRRQRSCWRGQRQASRASRGWQVTEASRSTAIETSTGRGERWPTCAAVTRPATKNDRRSTPTRCMRAFLVLGLGDIVCMVLRRALHAAAAAAAVRPGVHFGAAPGGEHDDASVPQRNLLRIHVRRAPKRTSSYRHAMVAYDTAPRSIDDLHPPYSSRSVRGSRTVWPAPLALSW